jgi:hypothetical protein
MFMMIIVSHLILRPDFTVFVVALLLLLPPAEEEEMARS